MPIPIECEACHRQYTVDDKLAGKKVKCKGCGELIRVPGGDSAGGEPRECLSCGAPLMPGSRICARCGFNLQTGQKESLLLEEELEEIKARKKRRWERKTGSALLESLDELIKLLALLGLLGGIAMTVVHICRTPEGFTWGAVLPTLVVLAALLGIMAPLAALAVNITVRAMKLAAREDTYVRLAVCMLLPFVFGMLAGWPEMAGSWGWVAGLGWPAAILLLIYFFRAEVLEWAASVVAAAGALALSLIVVNLLGGAVNDLAGGLYADMLPSGPWTGLAGGHSPAPPALKTQPQPAPGGPDAALPATRETGGGPAAAATREDGAATAAAAAATTTATRTAATSVAAATLPQVVVKMTSPYFAGVIDEAGPHDAAAIVPPAVPGDWMLAVKHTETTMEVDRWSTNPPEKKEHLSYPYYARKAPQFALAAKGDALAVLSFFPRRQLEVVAFDNKTPKRTLLLDLPANIPDGAAQAAPALLGIVDLSHYYLRWDLNGQSVVQAFNGTGAPPWRAAPMGAAVETSPAAFAPNGHTAAVFGRNQVSFCNVDGTTPPRPIIVASDLNVRLLGMAFSSDSGQIGVFAAVSGLPTVMVYQVKNGDTVSTTLLSQTPLDKDAEALPHALLWLPGAQAWLINGNELVDAATGKDFAALGLSGVAEAQVVGPSMLALTFKAEGGPRTILAKLDDEKIRAAKGK